MASVSRVYSALKDLANKDQRGFITPAIFNNFAQVAQMSIFNKLFTDFEQGKIARIKNIDPSADKSKIKRVEEDLAYFSKTAVISQANSVFAKPADLARIISATSSGSILLNQSTRINIPFVYDQAKVDYIMLSELSKPTEVFPIAVVGEDIEVYPTTIKKIRLNYYKQPQGRNTVTGVRTSSQPRFGYTVVAGKEVYSVANSVDFELPEHYFADLVIEIAKLVGVNLRDQDVYAYADAEEKANM
jgi:hypothetical protein